MGIDVKEIGNDIARMASHVPSLLNDMGVVKKEVKRFSDAVPGLKADIDGLKVALSAVTVSAQILKVDMSLWKIDEKGITFRGNQKVTWSWVKSVEDEKKAKTEEKLMLKLRETFLEKGKNTEIEKAQRTANHAAREVRVLKDTLRSAGKDARFEPTKNKREEYNKLRNSVTGLSNALAGI
ncbi:hypothetical protein ABZ896_06055 [Streptomyces sp. NPDC047072]|uniref:hypothetical protein n=1 Tax=Streptomyces sp. NPDC047072 TaxID=3154809 RepID=UPI0033E9009F